MVRRRGGNTAQSQQCTAASQSHQGPAPRNKENSVLQRKKKSQDNSGSTRLAQEERLAITTGITSAQPTSRAKPALPSSRQSRPRGRTQRLIRPQRTPARPGERGEEMAGERYSKNGMPPKSRPSCRSRSAACDIPTRTSPGTPESARPPSSSRACRSWEFRPNAAARTTTSNRARETASEKVREGPPAARRVQNLLECKLNATRSEDKAASSQDERHPKTAHRRSRPQEVHTTQHRLHCSPRPRSPMVASASLCNDRQRLTARDPTG